VNLPEPSGLNIIKTKYDLIDKSAAIDKMAEEYEDVILEPELKPEYIKKLKKNRETGSYRSRHG
jgi:hypothetical protein